jgi:hypothetical protein
MEPHQSQMFGFSAARKDEMIQNGPVIPDSILSIGFRSQRHRKNAALSLSCESSDCDKPTPVTPHVIER